MSEVILEIHNLHKSFGALKATQDVSLTLKKKARFMRSSAKWGGQIDADQTDRGGKFGPIAE